MIAALHVASCHMPVLYRRLDGRCYDRCFVLARTLAAVVDTKP